MMKQFTYKAFKKDIIDSINKEPRKTIDSFIDLENTIKTLSIYGYLTNNQSIELSLLIFQKKRSLIHWDDVKEDFEKELNRSQ